jgi:AcrR family transcriptional regulator
LDHESGQHQDLPVEISPKQVQLIRRTYRLMGAKGADRLTLQDVADAARVSKAVIVYYFKTKENLVLTTMRWVLSQVVERIRQALTGAATAEEKVTAMIDAIFIDPKRNRNFYLAYLNLIDQAARHRRFNELSTTFRSIVDGQYAEVVEAGIAEGTFRQHDAQQAAMVVRAIVDGLFLQWLQERDWQQLHGTYKEVCRQAILAYLRRQPDREPAAV